MLAEAADVLSDQLLSLLARLARALEPESALLERRFLTHLERLGFDEKQRRALSCLTLGRAARSLSRGSPTSNYFEEVEYQGRRLAKLNLSPSAIVTALATYDRLIDPVLRRVLPGGRENFQWARDQLQFCVMLTLNNAYYHVREAETEAFYQMFWAELESTQLDELLGRLLAILARFCRADQGQLYLAEGEGTKLVRHASFGGPPGAGPRAGFSLTRQVSVARCASPARGTGWILDPSWNRFATCWSVPMTSEGRLAGVMQFGFVRPYEWLPREQDLLTAAAERCVKAAEKARLVEDLSAQERKVRQLAETMVQVEESERRRISRELHDQTGQDLLWIRLQMEMLERELPESEREWRSRVGQLRDMTERTIVEIRRLIAALSPAVLDQLGLAAALRQLMTRFQTHSGMRARLRLGRLGGLSKRLEVIVYRLVQECLNNVAKHSQCSHVNVSVATADGKLRLTVADNGVGFSVEEALTKPGSFGLAGIRERVELMGGRCEIRSLPAANRSRRQNKQRKTGGTSVLVELPVVRATATEVGEANGPGADAQRARRQPPKAQAKVTSSTER